MSIDHPQKEQIIIDHPYILYQIMVVYIYTYHIIYHISYIICHMPYIISCHIISYTYILYILYSIYCPIIDHKYLHISDHLSSIPHSSPFFHEIWLQYGSSPGACCGSCCLGCGVASWCHLFWLTGRYHGDIVGI